MWDDTLVSLSNAPGIETPTVCLEAFPVKASDEKMPSAVFLRAVTVVCESSGERCPDQKEARDELNPGFLRSKMYPVPERAGLRRVYTRAIIVFVVAFAVVRGIKERDLLGAVRLRTQARLLASI